MRYVPLITIYSYVPVITVYKIYIINYTLSFIFCTLQTKMNQTSNHMDTNIFMWKPSDWGENDRSFTNFKIYFSRINRG